MSFGRCIIASPAAATGAAGAGRGPAAAGLGAAAGGCRWFGCYLRRPLVPAFGTIWRRGAGGRTFLAKNATVASSGNVVSGCNSRAGVRAARPSLFEICGIGNAAIYRAYRGACFMVVEADAFGALRRHDVIDILRDCGNPACRLISHGHSAPHRSPCSDIRAHTHRS